MCVLDPCCNAPAAVSRWIGAQNGLAASARHAPSPQVSALRSQLESALSHLGATEGEQGALREEYRALGEDMEALVRENQVGGARSSPLTARLSGLTGVV
jgi:hypothetical protein